MANRAYTELWNRYNQTLSALSKSGASKTSNGLEKAYGQAADKLMRVGELYKIKGKYRGVK